MSILFPGQKKNKKKLLSTELAQKVVKVNLYTLEFQLMYEEERKYKLEDIMAMRSYRKLEELLKLCPELQHSKNSFAAFFIKRGKESSNNGEGIESKSSPSHW